MSKKYGIIGLGLAVQHKINNISMFCSKTSCYIKCRMNCGEGLNQISDYWLLENDFCSMAPEYVTTKAVLKYRHEHNQGEFCSVSIYHPKTVDGHRTISRVL
jgi:hypothetical protein